jgi:hypothetical protein
MLGVPTVDSLCFQEHRRVQLSAELFDRGLHGTALVVLGSQRGLVRHWALTGDNQYHGFPEFTGIDAARRLARQNRYTGNAQVNNFFQSEGGCSRPQNFGAAVLKRSLPGFAL